MGRAKEEQLEREEQARLHAPKCEICNSPLMTPSERSNRCCSGCRKAMDSD